MNTDQLRKEIEDTLAYYQCRETNPKADHPQMGYHAFSEDQREFLQAKKSEAAAEVVRMIDAEIRKAQKQDSAELERWRDVAQRVEPILALLHYRGLRDSELNREDVKAALTLVRSVMITEDPS